MSEQKHLSSIVLKTYVRNLKIERQTEVQFIIGELLTNAGLSIHPDTVLVIVNCILEAFDKPIIVITPV